MFHGGESTNVYKDMAEMARQSFNKNILEKRHQQYNPKPKSTTNATNINVKVKTIHKTHYNIHLSNKTPILPHKELELLEDNMQLKLPEMTFVNNGIRVNYNNLYEYSLNSMDCLNSVKRAHNDEIQVSNSKHWEKHKISTHSNEEKTEDDGLNFDWTYSPIDYIGKVNLIDNLSNIEVKQVNETESKIPYSKLSLRVPIKHFSTILHFEDELNDNGVALLYSRIRVVDSKIPLTEKKIKYCYILTRFFLKVDKVISKVIDLRTYINLKKPSRINIQLDEYRKVLDENCSDKVNTRINKLKSFEDIVENEHTLLEDFVKLEEKSKFITFIIDNI